MTHRERAEELCERWFDTKARASWCPAMVDGFAAALREVERETWEQAAEIAFAEQVDAEATGEESDKAYNRACVDIHDACHAKAQP